MSQVLSQALKPHVYQNIFRHNNMVRWCSYTPIYSYLLIDHLLNLNIEDSLDGRVVRGEESEGEREIIITDYKLAEEVRNAMTVKYDQRGVRLQKKSDIIYLGLGKGSIQLPCFPTRSQIQNLAMSFLPSRSNEDWVVAIKYSGSKLKLYRNHKDLWWVDISSTHECISPYSSLMYSKKDQRFYVPSPGGRLLCSFDLNYNEKGVPDYNLMCKRDIPNDMWYELEEMNSFTRTDHMVESPSGQQFLITWYYGDEYDEEEKVVFSVRQKTKRFMVFRKKEGLSTDKQSKSMFYTENIGDLCVFLGHGEAFCVPANSSPGLKRNCIYFVGPNYGVFDITTQTCTLFYTLEGPLRRSTHFPYWPHPLSITPN